MSKGKAVRTGFEIAKDYIKKGAKKAKKPAIATGVAGAGYGAYNLMQDEEEDTRFENMDKPVGEAKTTSEVKSVQQAQQAQQPGPQPEEVKPIEPDYKPVDKVAAPQVKLEKEDYLQNIDSLPDYPDDKRADQLKAMMDDMRQKNEVAMQAYRKETSDVKRRKMWDGIIKGVAMVAAGMYAFKSNADVGKLNIDLEDFTNEYESAYRALKGSQAINRQNFDMARDIARVSREDQVDKWNSIKDKINVDLQKADRRRQAGQDQTSNLFKQAQLAIQSEQLTQSKQAQADRKAMGEAGLKVDQEKIQAQRDANDARIRKDLAKLSTTTKTKSQQDASKQFASLRLKLATAIENKKTKEAQNIFNMMEELGPELGLDPKIFTEIGSGIIWKTDSLEKGLENLHESERRLIGVANKPKEQDLSKQLPSFDEDM